MGTGDILILLFIVIFAFKGLYKGLIIEAVGILGIVLAFLFSFMIYKPINMVIMLTGIDEKLGSLLTYIIAFFLVYTIVFLLGLILHKFITAIQLGIFNRIGGFLFGILKGAVLMSVILWTIIFILPQDTKLSKDIKSSTVAKTTMEILPAVYKKLNSIAGFKRINPFD